MGRLKLRGISRLGRIVAAAALMLLGMPLAAAGPEFAGTPEAQNGRGQAGNVVEVSKEIVWMSWPPHPARGCAVQVTKSVVVLSTPSSSAAAHTSLPDAPP